MLVVACIKQVPDTTNVRINPETNTLMREGVESIINPFDMYALEEGIRLKERHGGSVIALSMGPPQALDALREAKAMGTDDNILLSDRAFAGADTWATAYTLATAIKKNGEFDLIICGRQAIDGDTAQVGPQVAECLGLPQVTYVRKLEIEGETLKAERALEDGFEKIETTLPALITVIKELNKPRYPSVSGIVEACRVAKYPVWTAEDIKADPSNIGLDGSRTQVKRSFAPEPHGGGIMLEGSTEQMAKDLVSKLKDDNVV